MESSEAWILIQLQRKIDKIENTDSNYTKNTKWKKYRKQQNFLYEKIKKKNEKGIER